MNFFEMERVAIVLRSWRAYARFVVIWKKKHHLQNVCLLLIFFLFLSEQSNIIFLSGRDSSILWLLGLLVQLKKVSLRKSFLVGHQPVCPTFLWRTLFCDERSSYYYSKISHFCPKVISCQKNPLLLYPLNKSKVGCMFDNLLGSDIFTPSTLR